MAIEEEGYARGEGVDVEPGVDRRLDIGDAVGEGEGDFLDGGRACLAHVVPGNGDRVPVGHLAGGEGEDVGDDAHRLLRRVNVGAARDVLLEDVVLHRAAQLANVSAGAPGHHDV